MTADTTPESSERTPTTAEVRMAYGDMYCRNPDDPAHSEGCPQDVDFDRWLAAHDAEVARKTLADAAEKWVHSAWADVPRIKDQVQERLSTANYVGDWLRDRAEQIGEHRG